MRVQVGVNPRSFLSAVKNKGIVILSVSSALFGRNFIKSLVISKSKYYSNYSLVTELNMTVCTYLDETTSRYLDLLWIVAP